MLTMAVVAATIACYAQKETIVFTPQWTAQAQFAGYYVAMEKGFFKQAGVNVKIVHPSVTQPALSRMLNNESQATTLQLCQAMEVIDMGEELVIISARNKNPLTQKGQRVGIWSAGFGQVAICMSIKEGLDYEWVPFATNVSLFVSGALDATLAMSYNEYYQIMQAGMQLTEKNVYRFCDHGYNIQEDGVYMTRAYYEKHRDQARAFAEACKKGWQWAAEHQEETLDIVMKYVKAERIATNRTLQRLMLKEVLRLQVDRESKKREFRLRPDMVKNASRLMQESKMLVGEVKYEDLISK